MAKYETPPHLTNKLASRAERAAFSRMTIERNTCPWCKGVFVRHGHSQLCEDWHKRVFRQQRADLAGAIAKLDEAIRENPGASAGIHVKARDRLLQARKAIPDV